MTENLEVLREISRLEESRVLFRTADFDVFAVDKGTKQRTADWEKAKGLRESIGWD